jgi:Ca2+-binding RTX toxin-like protein
VEVERIDLVDGALQATGNDLGQVIAGNEANNVLSGAGGADNLKGGAGDDTLDGGSGNDILNGGGGGDRMLGGSGDDEYLVNNAFDVVVEALDAGTDIVSSSVDFVLGDHVEKLTLTGTAALGTGNVLANTLLGNASANTLEGRDGADTLTGGGGADRYVLTSTVGSDTITDFASGSDRLVVSQATLAVRNGDAVLDNATSIAAPGGFAVNAEYVVVTTNLSGAITAAKASAAIGSATSAYTVGTTRLFMVDNGTDSALYLFTSGDADAAVETAELTLLATLQGTGSTTTADLVFGP